MNIQQAHEHRRYWRASGRIHYHWWATEQMPLHNWWEGQIFDGMPARVELMNDGGCSLKMGKDVAQIFHAEGMCE